MADISASVGRGGVNRDADVRAVQTLLNRHIRPPMQPLRVDGDIGPKTIAAIEDIQRRVAGLSNPDGRVDPNGRTLRALNGAAAGGGAAPQPPQGPAPEAPRGGLITADKLTRFAPNAPNIQQQAAALETARAGSTVTTVQRLAYFLGQIYVETGGLRTMAEDLNYRNAARLDSLFSAVNGTADAQALIARGAEAIANRVYANRLGNGNEASGDGWRYRGSGYKQLTGRSNYREIGAIVGLPLEAQPEIARQYGSGARVAFAYWDARGCAGPADRGDISEVTRLVNGPRRVGLAERRAATARALQIWGG